MKNEDDEYKIGLAVIDIFSKCAKLIHINTKQPQDVLDGLIKAFHHIGGACETIYSDDESSLNSKRLLDYVEEHKIRKLTTRTHAGVVERFIRTIKDMIYKRLEKNKEAKWCQIP